MDSDKRMGQRIREMREQKEWTQAELARRIGVSRATVNQWESGRIKNIRLRTVLKVVSVLGTTLQYLVLGPSQPARQRAAAGSAPASGQGGL